jgi:hypothetical protein
MGLLQQSVQNRLSALLGARVTFDKLSFSLLGGSIDAHGITVIVDDPAIPVLTIRRVRAEISLRAAFKREFVIKSLTVERPVITLQRDAEGRINLPDRFQSQGPRAADASATVRQTSDIVSDASVTDVAEGTWKFEARKVLVVEGEVHVRDHLGYHAVLTEILGEVKEADGGLEYTLIVDSVTRRDRPAGPVQIRMQGRASNVPDLSQWQDADVHGTIEVGASLRLRVHAPSLQPVEVHAEISGSADLSDVAPFVPEGIKALDVLRSGALRAKVEVSGRASFDTVRGLRAPELTARVRDLVFTPVSSPVRG